MPSIIKNEDQLKALAEIESGLETVDQINQVIAANGAGVFIGSQGSGKGRNAATRIEVSENENKALISLLGKIKTRLAKEIRGKATKYNISLDADDQKKLETEENK